MALIRRAGARWRQSAPAYVVDCLDHPPFDDRFTVVIHNRDEIADGWVSFIGLSADGRGYWGQMRLHEMRQYRAASSKRRVRWLDLPKPVRREVEARMAAE